MMPPAPARPITAPLPLRTTPMWRMRPIDFCKPTDLPSTCGSFDSSIYIEGGTVDAVFLASAFAIAFSAISPSFTAMSPALSSRTGIGSVAVPEAVFGGLEIWIGTFLWKSYEGDLRRCLTFAGGVSGLRSAIDGDASDTIVAQGSSSPTPSRRGPRSPAASSKASGSWAPGAFAPASAPRCRDRFTRPWTAAPATRMMLAFARRPALWGSVRASMSSFSRSLIRPRAAVITRCKLLRSANITAGPLAELPAIELSIREHDRVRSRPARFRDRPAFLGAGLRASMSGAGRLSLPGGGRHLHRSRGADGNPLLPRLDITQTPLVASWWRNPAQGPGSRPPINVSLARIVWQSPSFAKAFVPTCRENPLA